MTNVCPPDDLKISNNEKLLRRLPPIQVKPNGKISESAFDEFKCSVERLSLSSPEKCLAHMYPDGFDENKGKRISKKKLAQGWRVCSIEVVYPRTKDQTIYPEPNVEIQGKEIENPAHCIICGDKKSGNVHKFLADKSRLEIGVPK